MSNGSVVIYSSYVYRDLLYVKICTYVHKYVHTCINVLTSVTLWHHFPTSKALTLACPPLKHFVTVGEELPSIIQRSAAEE